MENRVVLRFSNGFLLYNVAVFGAVAWGAWAALAHHLWLYEVGVRSAVWGDFWLLLFMAAPVVLQGYGLLQFAFWRLRLYGDEIEVSRLFLPNKTVSIGEITHFVERRPFVFRFVHIYAGKKRVAALLTSCRNYSALYDGLIAAGVSHFDLGHDYGRHKYKRWKKDGGANV